MYDAPDRFGYKNPSLVKAAEASIPEMKLAFDVDNPRSRSSPFWPILETYATERAKVLQRARVTWRIDMFNLLSGPILPADRCLLAFGEDECPADHTVVISDARPFEFRGPCLSMAAIRWELAKQGTALSLMETVRLCLARKIVRPPHELEEIWSVMNWALPVGGGIKAFESFQESHRKVTSGLALPSLIVESVTPAADDIANQAPILDSDSRTKRSRSTSVDGSSAKRPRLSSGESIDEQSHLQPSIGFSESPLNDPARQLTDDQIYDATCRLGKDGGSKTILGASKPSFCLTEGDLWRLITHDGWLNDEVINAWGTIIMSSASPARKLHISSTFFWTKLTQAKDLDSGYEQVRSWLISKPKVCKTT